MAKKQVEYGIYGLLIGIIAGFLLGLGELNWIKKSQRSSVATVVIGITCIVTAGTGFGIGAKMGKEAFIEEQLGLDRVNDAMWQEGRFWVAQSSWNMRIKGDPHELVTRRNGGALVTTYNNQQYIVHPTNSGSNVNVTKYHREAKQKFIALLKQTYDEHQAKGLVTPVEG